MSKRGLGDDSCLYVIRHTRFYPDRFWCGQREIDTGDQLIDTASQSSAPHCFALELESIVLLTSPPWRLAASLRRIFLTDCEVGGCGLLF
jgi:hypothetical protein